MALQPFWKSLTAKIFMICFVSIHVPLIAVIAYLAIGFESRPLTLLLLLLGATLIGTVACLSGLWLLLRPMRTLTRAVKTYRDEGQPVRLFSKREDEIGVLATAVTSMVSEVETLMQKLRHQAMTDPLTGLGNRRWLSERVAQELARAERQAEPVSVILFDLDKFKGINDSHGHEIGDQVLVAVGEIATNYVRPYDLAARIGGEEFCIVLPKTCETEAADIAERLRAALAKTTVTPLAQGRLTASFGVYQGGTGETFAQMLRIADTLLYDAKQSGRNCVRQATRNEAGKPENSDVVPG
jgi:diguanylate cyclase (GGDEF)-like protein